MHIDRTFSLNAGSKWLNREDLLGRDTTHWYAITAYKDQIFLHMVQVKPKSRGDLHFTLTSYMVFTSHGGMVVNIPHYQLYQSHSQILSY